MVLHMGDIGRSKRGVAQGLHRGSPIGFPQGVLHDGLNFGSTVRITNWCHPEWPQVG
jgi:hypothetical protein